MVEGLKLMSAPDRQARIAELGLSVGDVENALSDPGCASVGMKQLADYVVRPGPPNFSVGFTSVAAGTMLAAQAVCVSMGLSLPTSDDPCSKFFYFLNPGARSVRLGRNRACNCGTYGRETHRRIWSGATAP